MLKNAHKKTDEGENSKFYCEICHYRCSRKFLMSQHEATKKHISAYMLMHNGPPLSDLHICRCKKSYKHIQSFNRHVKTCTAPAIVLATDSHDISPLPVVSVQSDDAGTDNMCRLISQLIRQNNSIIVENGEMRKIVRELIPKVGSNNTTVNAQFNIQMFLNEQCKDALNLTDFVQMLQLESADLDITRTNGYADGIASIFVRGMRQLELHKRPIHCSDIKREVLYVKDNNTWEREGAERPKIRNAITTVAKKQVDAIKEWEETHPDWMNTDSGANAYCEMIREVTAGGGEDELDNRIIRTIAKEVVIDKMT